MNDKIEPIPSTAAIAGHAIHPLVIPFPIAFLIGALASDLAHILTDDPFWARGSLWLIGAGLVMGAAAATFGLIDFLTIRRARRPGGWIHFLGNGLVLVLALINLFLRSGDPEGAILPWGLVLTAIMSGILGITGWFGGELAHSHLIGATPPK